MNELIKINYDSDRPTVLARDLHEFLEVESNYTTWFKRMCEYGFTEGNDFRNDKGKEARLYFINLEKQWNSPEMVMSRALKMAENQIKQLSAVNSQLKVDNTIMKPKADYFDELVDRNLLTSFRETAKQLGIGEKKFVKFLIEHKYIYRDKKGKIMPYADKNKGLFELKETFNEKTNWSGTQTLITPKGRETFRLLLVKAV